MTSHSSSFTNRQQFHYHLRRDSTAVLSAPSRTKHKKKTHEQRCSWQGSSVNQATPGIQTSNGVSRCHVFKRTNHSGFWKGFTSGVQLFTDKFLGWCQTTGVAFKMKEFLCKSVLTWWEQGRCFPSLLPDQGRWSWKEEVSHPWTNGPIIFVEVAQELHGQASIIAWFRRRQVGEAEPIICFLGPNTALCSSTFHSWLGGTYPVRLSEVAKLTDSFDGLLWLFPVKTTICR